MKKKLYDFECVIEKLLHDYEIVNDVKIKSLFHSIANCDEKRAHLICIKVNDNMD